MVLAGEPPAKIFTVRLSYWRISKETYYGLPTPRVIRVLWMPEDLSDRDAEEETYGKSPGLQFASYCSSIFLLRTQPNGQDTMGRNAKLLLRKNLEKYLSV